MLKFAILRLAYRVIGENREKEIIIAIIMLNAIGLLFVCGL